MAKSELKDDIPKGLEEEEFFHGLLPREDCNELLVDTGDFLVRVSQPRPTDPRELIISLRISKDTSASAVRHVIVKKQKLPNGDAVWIAIEALKFPTFFELIDHYLKSRSPINPEIPSSVLFKPVKRQAWEFNHEDVTLKKLLGAGAFGEVRSGELYIDKKKVDCAVKLAKITNEEAHMQFRKEKIKEMMHEARLMRHYDHDNVVRIYGVAVDREPLMIVIELIHGGSIFDDLRSRKGTIEDIEKMDRMCLGTAKGLQYLHMKQCIHRDIAARNVLYTTEKVAKISDFGLSREGTLYKMKLCKKVPIKWTAPETISTFIYTAKTDVFSFSILVWEVFSDGEEPYKGLPNVQVKKMVLAGSRMDIPECPDGIGEVMERCWDQDVKTRWSMTDAVTQLANLVARRLPQSSKVSSISGSATKSDQEGRVRKKSKSRYKSRKIR